MKRILALTIALLLLAGCGQVIAENPADTQGAGNQPLRVVTSIFPQFDFVRQIAGDRVELTMLLSPGMESHSFEPTPRDIITINNADLFIYVCSDAEEWVNPIITSLERDDMTTVALISMIEPIEADHDHDHDHNHNHDHDHDYGHDHDLDHHHNYDEHVWTSPRNAIIIVEQLTEILAQLDPDNADSFRANAAAYISALEELDSDFAEVVAGGVRNTLVFGDRFPFLYFTQAYGLSAYSALDGCGTQTQASPARIASLIDRLNEENIPVVFYIELSNHAIANVIAEETGVRMLELHSAHNVSHADFMAGVTFLDIMSRNLEHLREALS